MKNMGKKKKKGKKILWILLILVVGFIGVGLWKAKNSQNQILQTVQVTKAYRGDLQEELGVTGTVRGEQVETVCAPANGEIQEVFVRSGDEVKAGTLLASYNTDKLDQALYQAKLENEKMLLSFDNTLEKNKEGKGKVKEADTNITVLKQQIEDHENFLKNLQTQLANDQTDESNEAVLENYQLKKEQAEVQKKLSTLTPGTEEFDKANQQMESILNRLEQVTLRQSLSTKSDRQKELEKQIADEQKILADLQEYKAKMDAQKTTGEAGVLDKYGSRQLEIEMELTELAYQKQLEEAETAKQGVTADWQGVITNLTITPKTQVVSGMQLMTIERTDKMKVTASASKYVLERLEIGQKVDVKIGERTYAAEVSHIDRFAEAGAVNGSMAVGFEVELLETSEKIFLGAEAKMTIFAGKAQNALLVPTAAVRANKDGDFVYVVQDGKIVKKAITCGIITKGKAEITSGITEADELVVEYTGDIQEGMEVDTIPAPEAE